MTDRQNAILAYVTDYWVAHGYGPSLRDVTQAMGLSSTSVASYNLGVLQRRGLVMLGEEGQSRSTIRPATYGEHWREGRYQP